MSTTSRPEVHVSGGTVRGRSEDGLVVFRGIPFAQPPVGEHRFAAPQPARNSQAWWTEAGPVARMPNGSSRTSQPWQ